MSKRIEAPSENGDGLKNGPRLESQDPESGAKATPQSIMQVSVLSEPLSDVFVQHDKSFRRTERKLYERMLEVRTNNSVVDINRSKSVQAALTVQNVFHNISLIMQGFLSGFGTAHAIFAFVFVDAEIVRRSYMWLAMLTQIIFYVCLVMSTIAAIDRFEMGSSMLDSLKRGLNLQRGSLGILLCLVGTIATLASTLFDEWLIAPSQQREQIQDILHVNPLVAWRSLSGVRAIAAFLSWLLLALPSDNSFLLQQIRSPEAENEHCEGS